MLENITLKDLSDLAALFNKNDNKKTTHKGEEVRIVILQRGWVIIGKYYQEGSECWVENGFVIRQWGTNEGLGELAFKGKRENTILDAIPLTKFHELTVVASLICDSSKWKEIL